MPTTLQSKSSVGSMRLQHSDGRTAETKVQFPELPREWQGKYVKGEMYKYQDSLPKLPVPPLQQTLKKYLAAIRVCCTDFGVYLSSVQNESMIATPPFRGIAREVCRCDHTGQIFSSGTKLATSYF